MVKAAEAAAIAQADAALNNAGLPTYSAVCAEPTDADDDRAGLAIIEALNLPAIRYGDQAGRYRTLYGTKTPAGLARFLRRILAGEVLP